MPPTPPPPVDTPPGPALPLDRLRLVEMETVRLGAFDEENSKLLAIMAQQVEQTWRALVGDGKNPGLREDLNTAKKEIIEIQEDRKATATNRSKFLWIVLTVIVGGVAPFVFAALSGTP